jgi:lysophospholipase L1-like esterase
MMRRIITGLLLTAAAVTVGVLIQRRRLHWISVLTNRIPAHHVYWRERGRADPDAVLYVALGDSAALGIGASQPERGYVGLLAAEIADLTGRRVRVRNLSIDGATLDVCLREQLPRLAGLHPVVCTVGIGANDVWTFEPARFRSELERICEALPPGAIVAELPSFSIVPVAGRVRRANRIVHDVAEQHGFWVAPLHATTSLGGLADALLGAAGDLFHPNDRGHRRWAEAFRPGLLAALQRADLLTSPEGPRHPSSG